MIDSRPRVITMHGETIFNKVFCEISGEHICWSSSLEDWDGPVFLSFDVLNEDGIVLNPDELLKIGTF